MYGLHMRHTVYIRVYKYIYIDTLLGLQEKFFTLYGQSALKSRPMERSAGTSLPRPATFPFSRIHFLRPPTHDRTYTHGERRER